MLTPTRVPLWTRWAPAMWSSPIRRVPKQHLLPESMRHRVWHPWVTPVLDGSGECYQKTPKLKMTTSPRPASKYSPKTARHRREAQQPPVRSEEHTSELQSRFDLV